MIGTLDYLAEELSKKDKGIGIKFISDEVFKIG